MKTDDDSDYKINTPIGMVHVYYRPSPFSITEIGLPAWEVDAGPIQPAPVRTLVQIGLAGLRQITDLLADYFKGKAVEPPWDLLDMDGLTLLQRRVLRMVAAIPFGGLKTYGEIADAVGCPRAGRFVGNTMAGNPFPLIVPCHRVIRRGGGIGGFGGGPDLKKRLIAFEKDSKTV